MIFLTVGSQMPFDRLVRAMDVWAGEHPAHEVFAQIGKSAFRPIHMDSCLALSPADFRTRVEAAEVVVAHAGMGSVLTALEFARPLVLMPRRGDLRETRNDHQLATVRWLGQKPGIEIALGVPDLAMSLERALNLRGSTATRLQSYPGALGHFLRRYFDQVAAEVNQRAD